MRLALLALLLPALALADVPDGGSPRVALDVATGDLLRPDGGLAHVEGGVWLDSATARATAQEVADCRAAPASSSPGAVGIVVGLVFILAAGAGGYVLGHSGR